MTTQDGGLRPADIETDDTDAATASEQDVDVEVAYGADVASHSYTGSDDDPAAADDVVTEESATDESATEESVADEPAEPVETDPAEEMRAALRRAPGDWYVVHSYAGYENKVKTNLETRVQTLDVEDYIFQVEVPTEEVTEIKNGQRKQVNRKVLPGYILVRMELNDESWGAVRNTPGVTGFVGATSRPSPLSLDDVVIASFTTGPGSATLPIRIYSEVRLGVKPEINAICTMVIALIAVVIVIASLASKLSSSEAKSAAPL